MDKKEVQKILGLNPEEFARQNHAAIAATRHFMHILDEQDICPLLSLNIIGRCYIGLALGWGMSWDQFIDFNSELITESIEHLGEEDG